MTAIEGAGHLDVSWGASRPQVNLEWGLAGARYFAENPAPADVIVIIDVLCFSTSVTVACERGARIWPHPGGEGAHDLARSIEAVLAGTRSHTEGPSLSPASLMDLQPGTRLVLPSEQGSAIAHGLMGAKSLVLVGCLRNADAVARRIVVALEEGASSVALVPAGELWTDGSLRVSYEDLVGAGAIVHRLLSERPDVDCAPESRTALQAFAARAELAKTPSGRELIDRDFAVDVRLASELNVSASVPVLRDGSIQAQ
ncbi:MAG: 2-phosphosulfolactate phosphatase [Angustibacter sp.]